MIASPVIKKANIKKKFNGKEHKGEIYNEEELNVCLFSVNDHKKSGKYMYYLCLLLVAC